MLSCGRVLSFPKSHRGWCHTHDITLTISSWVFKLSVFHQQVKILHETFANSKFLKFYKTLMKILSVKQSSGICFTLLTGLTWHYLKWWRNSEQVLITLTLIFTPCLMAEFKKKKVLCSVWKATMFRSEQWKKLSIFSVLDRYRKKEASLRQQLQLSLQQEQSFMWPNI